MTEKKLENLKSQTEYSLTVTPVYDEGAGQAMTGSAVTGTNDKLSANENIASIAQFPDVIKLHNFFFFKMWFQHQRIWSFQKLPRPASEQPGSMGPLMWQCTVLPGQRWEKTTLIM